AVVLKMEGSFVLSDLSLTLLSSSRDCGGVNFDPANGVVYQGTGSGNGQVQMLLDRQSVAPMVLPMSAAGCASSPTAAEGIVFAMQSVTLVADRGTAEGANGPKVLTCDPLFDAAHPAGGGLVFNKVITPQGTNSCSGSNDTPAHQAAADA